MSKKTSKVAPEAQLLELLKQVLPKATPDPKLAGRIYDAIASELKAKSQVAAFEKFCARLEVPDLEAKSVASVREQLVASFGDGDVTVRPNRKEKSLSVEVALPDGKHYSSEVKVNPNAGAEGDEEQELTLKFVAFPVALPGDPELVWLLAKRENMTSEEAGIALSKVEEEFWESKTGQKLIRDRVDRCFPEFIARVPSGMLNEVGLKRHYKEPEALRQHRTLGEQRPKGRKSE